jgi:beta-galactosidase
VAFSPELGVGAPPWFAPRSELDSLQGALAACAYGLRGFNLYMAVDRDRWYGAPIDEHGELRPSAEPWRRLIAALARSEFHRLRRRAQVALFIPREYAQLSRATHMLGALSPNLLDLSGMPMSAASRVTRFGFEQPIQQAWEPLLERLDEALRRAQIPFVYVENDTDLDSLPDLRLVIAPSYEFADPERWARLRRFAERGGTVVAGPHLPHLDARMQPQVFAPIGDRPMLRAADAAQAQRLIGALVEELALDRPFPITPYPAHSAVHEDEHGVRVIFAINPGGTELDAELHVPAALRVRDALTDDEFHGTRALAIPLAAQTCRMLIVEEPARDQ